MHGDWLYITNANKHTHDVNINHRKYYSCKLQLKLPSVFWHCWLGGRKGIMSSDISHRIPLTGEGRSLVKMGEVGGGGHWLVRMEWRPGGWSVCLPLLIFPCTIKSRSSLLAPAHPGGPGKRAIIRLWCGTVEINVPFCVCLNANSWLYLYVFSTY